MSLQAAFHKRLRKAGPGGPGYGPSRRPQPGKGMGVAGGVAKPGWASTKQPIPGGGSKIASHKDKEGSTAHHAGSVGATFRPSPADPKRGELPKRPSAEERYAGRAPGDTSKPPRGWKTSRFNPKNKVRGGKFKRVPADNPYAGGHRNVEAAVMKAVRMVSKHKDKRGSTAHHGKGGGGAKRPALSVPEKHQLRIARETLRMRPEMVAVAGGPDVEESKKIIQRLTGGK